MVKHLLLVLSVTALALPHGATAAGAACTYTVDIVATPPDGTLHVSLNLAGGGGLSYVSLCNLNNVSDSIAPGACKAMQATLMLAKATNRPVMFWFDSPTAFSCTGLSWAPLRPAGWYWGPALL
jgi:hypothetical protein